MAEVTPNLGLKKPLESEFVSIQTLNENMDKVDQSLGPVEDLPTTAKNTAGAISEIYDQLADKPHEQLTLTPGVQIVQGGDVPAILHPTMQGRTLVNLLGRDGNCEDLSKWVPNGANSSITLDPVNKLYGNHALKITIVSGASATAYRPSVSVSNTKYYLVAADLNCGTANDARIFVDGNGTISAIFGNGITGNGFQISYRTLSISELGTSTSINVHTVVDGMTNHYSYADGYRIYEITAAEKTYIDSMTALEAQAYIKVFYPYVDDMKHINAVYIENRGKNLVDSFSSGKWLFNTGNAVSASVVVVDSDKVAVTTNGVRCESSCYIDVFPNTTYTFSCDHNGLIGVYNETGSTAIVTYKPSQVITFNSGDRSKISIWIMRDQLAGVSTFSNPMFNIGSEALPFQPQKPSYLYLPNCNLSSSVYGNSVDRLYTDWQGKPRVTRQNRETLLDGNAVNGVAYDYPGFKVIVFKASGGPPLNKIGGVKYDGKILTFDKTGTEADSWGIADGNIHLSVADTDSGWGESYTPTADEVKAYFNGWKMYPQGGLSTDQFISGTKFWCRRSEVSLTLTDVRTVVPTEISPNFTPYRLMYQLAQSVDEPVNYEGSLMLHEGDNQVEVGTGVVVREAANPTTDGTGNMYINRIVTPASRLKMDPTRFLAIFKEGEIDRGKWVIQTSPTRTGVQQAYSTFSNFGQAAAYSVTYLALDTYSIGIAPQSIGVEYVPNIREAVESLVREVVEVRAQTSVLQNTKAQKQPSQWIIATLLNEWMHFANGLEAAYRKTEFNNVELRGIIRNGITTGGTVLMYLPPGYHPIRATYVNVVNYRPSTNSIYTAMITIDTNGKVTLYGAETDTAVSFAGITFPTM